MAAGSALSEPQVRRPSALGRLCARPRAYIPVEHVTFKQTIASLRGNRPLLMLCMSTLIYLVGMSNGVGAFYARDVLGGASLFVPMTILTTIAFFVVAPLAPRLVVRIGKKGGYVLGGGLTVVGYVGAFLVPATRLWSPSPAGGGGNGCRPGRHDDVAVQHDDVAVRG